MKKNWSLALFRLFFVVLIVSVAACTTDNGQGNTRRRARSQHSKAELTEPPKPITIYIDAYSEADASLGTKEAPFYSLRQAFDYIDHTARSRDERSATHVVILSDLNCFKPILIQRPIVMIAEKAATIEFGKNGGFIVDGVSFTLKNCTIKRKERLYEPRDIPLLYASDSDVELDNTHFIGKEAYSLIRIYDSNFNCNNSTFTFRAAHSVSLLTVHNSKAVFNNSKLFVSANIVRAVWINNASLELHNSTLFMQAFGKGTGFMGRKGRILLDNTSVVCKSVNPFRYRFRTTVLDNKSYLKQKENSGFYGFYDSAPLEQAPVTEAK